MTSPGDDEKGTSPAGAESNTSDHQSPPQGTTNNNNVSAPASAPAPATKRTRVLLSCHPCRTSKLKCDRATPCSQCLKRGKPDACAYAPRAEKIKPAKTMAARLRRLEGMVRGMVELDGGNGGGDGKGFSTQGRNNSGSVVHSDRATNYVGGTHFMAVLEDVSLSECVLCLFNAPFSFFLFCDLEKSKGAKTWRIAQLEDLKTYFEDPEVTELDSKSSPRMVALVLLLLQKRRPFFHL